MSIVGDDLYSQAVNLHQQLGGKLETRSKIEIHNKEDLSLVYTPGVAQVCREIALDPRKVYDLTIKHNTVAIVSDGSAVLGLGNLGALAAIPVMEGKAILFKQYAGIDAFPICVNTQDTGEIIKLVKNIAPVFGGINLEDIAAPRCFEIEEALQDIGIPVFHDDQHGTAIVLLAALMNAAYLAGKPMTSLKVVINGAGAAGTAIARLLLCVGHDLTRCEPVKDVIVCDSQGIVYDSRFDIVPDTAKAKLAKITNRGRRQGTLVDAIRGADVFIGVSAPNVLTVDMIKAMNAKPIVFAMANPVPEIDPKLAQQSGAFIIGTGRSDYPNQVNNLLAFPGIFRGALDAQAPTITQEMKLAAAYALAGSVADLSVDKILPQVLEEGIAGRVARAVREACPPREASRGAS